MLNQTSNQYYPACLVDHLKVQNNLYNFTIICIVRVCTWHITDMGISWTAVHGVLPKLSKLRHSHKLRSHTETWRFYVADIHYISQNLSTLAVHIMRGKQSRAELLVGTGCMISSKEDFIFLGHNETNVSTASALWVTGYLYLCCFHWNTQTQARRFSSKCPTASPLSHVSYTCAKHTNPLQLESLPLIKVLR